MTCFSEKIIEFFSKFSKLLGKSICIQFLDPYTNETIEEEQGDDEIICTVEPHDSDNEEPLPQLVEIANENEEDAYGIFGHTAPRSRKASIPTTSSSPIKAAV